MADDELAKFLAGAKVRLAEAVTKAVNRAAIGLRDQVRGQVQSHFKGDKLAKAVRSRTYPQGRRSGVSAAGLVYIAADWIETHIHGATISAKEGYMAIPLPEAEARGYTVGCELPCYRHDGAWLPAVVLPPELGQAIAREIYRQLGYLR